MSYADLINAWDQIGAYNLGTAVTGAWLTLISLRASIRLDGLAKALALAFALVGLYISYRGGFWFAAHQVAPDGMLYHPWYIENRWTIWAAIIPMELALLGLYLNAFSDRRAVEVLIVGSVIGAYILGGLL